MFVSNVYSSLDHRAARAAARNQRVNIHSDHIERGPTGDHTRTRDLNQAVLARDQSKR